MNQIDQYDQKTYIIVLKIYNYFFSRVDFQNWKTVHWLWSSPAWCVFVRNFRVNCVLIDKLLLLLPRQALPGVTIHFSHWFVVLHHLTRQMAHWGKIIGSIFFHCCEFHVQFSCSLQLSADQAGWNQTLKTFNSMPVGVTKISPNQSRQSILKEHWQLSPEVFYFQRSKTIFFIRTFLILTGMNSFNAFTFHRI